MGHSPKVLKSFKVHYCPNSISELVILIDDFADVFNIEIELFAENDPQLLIPAAIFQIMLTNLIRNAIQHTSSGKISITLKSDRVSVSDTGAGMEPGDLKLVNQLHLRGDRYQGFGLGLSIVKRLCERLGWRLKIESEKGRGTKAQLIFS